MGNYTGIKRLGVRTGGKRAKARIRTMFRFLDGKIGMRKAN